ncbi:MAG: hypothetical protein ACXIUQ_10510 [Cecembia sp.]
MMNLNKILTIGAGAVLLLSSCSSSYNAMRGGETDDLYFMASDARVATEFAVNNNTPQTFQSLGDANTSTFDQENFSARNVNPEYLARYQSQTPTEDGGTVYFDDNGVQEAAPNVNVYNNFYGSGFNGAGFGQSRFNLNLGFGMGWGMPMMGWGMPMMGWGMPMMGMGMWDPFWDPFWGPGMGMGFGPAWGWGMRPGFGFGWNSMWGWNAGFGMGWGNPWMGGMWGWRNPWMGGMWGMGPGWGWGGPIFVVPGEPGRQIVRGSRYGRGAGTAVSGGRGSGSSYQPATTRAARRDAATGSRAISSGDRAASRDFGRSQNDYLSNRSRVANTNASARPSVRNTGSAAATRPGTRTGVANTRPSYNTNTMNRANTRTNVGAPSYNRGSSGATMNRGGVGTRSNSPSYNRGGGTFNNSRTAPSRNTMTPSRGGMSSPSRGSSGFSAPSRSSGGGFSSGGMSGGSRGGGGMSSGGSRGGRGN